MRKLLVILLLCLITTSVFGQFQHKPMLGVQVDGAHPLGDFAGAWFFNEGSGNIVSDLSGNNNTGTLVADTSWVPGKFGSCLDFDGTGDYVDIPTANYKFGSGSQDFSVSLWFKAAHNNAGSSYFIDMWDKDNDGWRFYYSSAENIWFSIDAIDVKSTTSLADTDWHHIAVTINRSGNGQIYIDGKPDGNPVAINSEAMSIARSSLYLGHEGPEFVWFNGLIDIPMIWNRALNASEIAELYRELFGMFVKDDIAILVTAAVPPPPPTGQVITIIMTSIPLFLIPFFFIKRRKLRR